MTIVTRVSRCFVLCLLVCFLIRFFCSFFLVLSSVHVVNEGSFALARYERGERFVVGQFLRRGHRRLKRIHTSYRRDFCIGSAAGICQQDGVRVDIDLFEAIESIIELRGYQPSDWTLTFIEVIDLPWTFSSGALATKQKEKRKFSD